MSLLPALFSARERSDEASAPASEPETACEPGRRDDDAFSLLPPRANDDLAHQPEQVDRSENTELIDRLDRIAGLERPDKRQTSQTPAKPATAELTKPE